MSEPQVAIFPADGTAVDPDATIRTTPGKFRRAIAFRDFVKLAESLRSLPCPPYLLPWLPSTSRRFGPPRRWVGVEEYFARSAGKLDQVYPATEAVKPRPISLNRVAPGHFKNLRDKIPPAYVFSLPRARLLGSAGWVVGERDSLLVESTFWREADFPHPFHTHHILSRKRPRPLRHLPGRTLSLASDFAIGGFGHFLHDSLPRLHLVEKAGYRLQQFDWLYLPRVTTAITMRLVAELDFPSDRILQYDPAFDLETDELVATTFPGTPGHIPFYTPQFLRERFAPRGVPATRRIFLSREGFRRDLVNRIEIQQVLLARGFEICRAHVDDAIQACAEARIIISQEGANLMNVLFAPPGTVVVMLLPETHENLPYAFTLAEAAGHELYVQSCPLEDSAPGKEGTSPVRADAAILAAGVDRILAGLTP